MKVKTRILRRQDSFVVCAYIDDKHVGSYTLWVNKDDNFVFSDMCSEKSKTGVPRALIARAAGELQSMSVQLGTELVHSVVLVNARSKKVLPHIFGEFGYRRIQDNDYQMIRTYRP